MATYYVRPDGNDSNTGLGSSTVLAWQTIGKIFASGSVVVGGDIVYIAPGTYTESISVLATSPTSEVQIIGNPTASLFSGINAGVVKLSAYNSAGTVVINNNTYLISATSKNYYSFSNLVFETAHTGTVSGVQFLTSRYIKFTKCVFRTENAPGTGDGAQVRITATASTPIDSTFDQCYFGATSAYGIYLNGASQLADTTTIKNCYFDSCQYGALPHGATAAIYNCTFVGGIMGVYQFTGSANAFITVKNCLFKRCTTGITGTSSVSGVQTYNRFIGCGTTVTNIPSSVTSSSAGVFGVDTFESLLFGLNNLQPGTSYTDSPNKSFGNATGAPTTDLYGVTWTGTSPDAGSGTYRPVGGVGAYYPTERNASTITIAPGSTSQSIELYLGATGLTASTSGLSARYNRTRTASVSIPLVARTIAQAWTSGGFAEVDATNMPGVYRLDVPDAALAAGADDVTIVVRGASGTNGAVMTIKLSSGGLTSAQTASAVWGADVAGYVAETNFGGVVNATRNVSGSTEIIAQDIPSNVWEELTTNHTTHNTFGWNILRADAQSKQGLVTLASSGGTNRVDADIHAIVNDTAAAAELKGALLHTGGDYISADLLTPVTSAQTVRIGPFAVRTDAGGADGALDLNQSTAGAVVVQLTDAQGTGIDQTSATVQAKVYNVAGGLVATYTCTPAYAVNGFVSIPMTTAVTGTAGSYIINLWSTVGSTVIIYGPLQLRVRAI